MKPCGANFKSKSEICIAGALFIAAILPALFAVRNIAISPDSMIYALISKEILSGNGISWPILYDLNSSNVFVDGAVPYLGQPPLLPILFALLGGVTPQNFIAAKIINVISHVACSIVSFLLMKKICDNKGISLLTGLLVSFSFPLLWNTHRMLSESLFIALAVAALYFLILSRHSDRYRSIGNLFVAAMCASAAILTRFSGVALIPVFFLELIIIVKNRKTAAPIISYLLIAILPIVTAGALFIRNYIISGTIFGWNAPSPERSYLSAFSGTLKMIILQFDLGERYIAVITISLILAISYMVLNTNARRELSKYIHSGLDLIIAFIISHTTLITYAMAKSQTVFELRYMSPLVPFLFIGCFLIIVVVLETFKHERFPRLSLYGTILFLSLITLGTCYKTYMKSEEIFSSDSGHYRILNSPAYHWIKENYGENVIITTNRPIHLSFFGGYSTIRLPHKRFEKNEPIPDNMEVFLPKRMSAFGSRVLALFEKADEQYEGNYVAGLFNKSKDDHNFVLVRKFSDGVVYTLKE